MKLAFILLILVIYVSSQGSNISPQREVSHPSGLDNVLTALKEYGYRLKEQYPGIRGRKWTQYMVATVMSMSEMRVRHKFITIIIMIM